MRKESGPTGSQSKQTRHCHARSPQTQGGFFSFSTICLRTPKSFARNADAWSSTVAGHTAVRLFVFAPTGDVARNSALGRRFSKDSRLSDWVLFSSRFVNSVLLRCTYLDAYNLFNRKQWVSPWVRQRIAGPRRALPKESD
jgi:hypothetical protein